MTEKVREPEEPTDEDLVAVRPADQSGAEDDPDADQQLDVTADPDIDAEFPVVDGDEDEEDEPE